MPESVMAGLNNSEQFLFRPWERELEDLNMGHTFAKTQENYHDSIIVLPSATKYQVRPRKVLLSFPNFLIRLGELD